MPKPSAADQAIICAESLYNISLGSLECLVPAENMVT
jgi:hypothetical protein